MSPIVCDFMSRVDEWIVPDKLYDAHCHFFTYKGMEKRAKSLGIESPEKLVEQRSQRIGRKFVLPPKKHEDLAAMWVKEMDTKGLDKALMLPDWNDSSFVEVATKLYPDRFVPFVMVNPKEENTLEFLEDAYSKLDIRGMKLYPPIHYYHAYEDFMTPIYEFAQDHEMLITYHMGISVGANADLRYMNPADVSPIARKFPKVNFAFAHFATGYLKELLFLMYHVKNVYAETSSSNRWMEYLPYDITLQDVFRKVINASSVDNIIFGTDSTMFPRGWRKPIYDWQLAVVNEIGLNKEEIDKIFYKNLERIARI